jgi:hypothetical protein
MADLASAEDVALIGLRSDPVPLSILDSSATLTDTMPFVAHSSQFVNDVSSERATDETAPLLLDEDSRSSQSHKQGVPLHERQSPTGGFLEGDLSNGPPRQGVEPVPIVYREHPKERSRTFPVSILSLSMNMNDA